MAAALGIEDLVDAAAALGRHTVAEATALLREAGVPAGRVVPRTLPLRDPFLVANAFSHLVPVPGTGTALVVDHFSRWPEAVGSPPGRWFEVGADIGSVFASD
jgi:crotonobetainyl-CoA:carnitine CoA-transferase CaiB-like acyl-CoA transferase